MGSKKMDEEEGVGMNFATAGRSTGLFGCEPKR
jgi:hypothetical protein